MKKQIDEGQGEFMVWVKKNALQLSMQVFAVVVLALATYITIRLAPLAEGIEANRIQIQAIQDRDEKLDPLIDRFLQLEQRDKNLEEDVAEMKQDIKDIRNYIYGR